MIMCVTLYLLIGVVGTGTSFTSETLISIRTIGWKLLYIHRDAKLMARNPEEGID